MTNNSVNAQIAKLKAENSKLRAENKNLKRRHVSAGHTAANMPKSKINRRHPIGAAILIGVAVLLAVVGNMLFWTGNTLVDTNRYTEAVAPIIKNSEVQTALSEYTTDQLFHEVDVTKYIGDVLPARANFLAPSISSQVKTYTQTSLNTLLASPKFQVIWNQVQGKAQTKFIATLKKDGSDGVISINDLYQQLSTSLIGTKLAFLANHKLPNKFGSIQILSGRWITVGHNVVTYIDLWRTLAIVLFLASGFLGIYLSRNRRRATVNFALISAGSLLVSLILIRLVREIIASKVNIQYTDAVRQAVQILFHPLVVQTATILFAFLLVALIAWISGPARSAQLVKNRIAILATGKIHVALFGDKENVVTLWLRKYKWYLEWFFVIFIGILALFNRLTPTLLFIYILLIIVGMLAVEVFSASDRQS